jgi:hypothetical protein
MKSEEVDNNPKPQLALDFGKYAAAVQELARSNRFLELINLRVPRYDLSIMRLLHTDIAQASIRIDWTLSLILLSATNVKSIGLWQSETELPLDITFHVLNKKREMSGPFHKFESLSIEGRHRSQDGVPVGIDSE